jgi:drug/metabolite transporter (DMT)-like permease
MQLAWTVAIYNTTATKAQMVTTLQAPTVILLSFLVFHEERAVIRNPKYLMGSLLCVMGVIGVYMRDNEGTLRFHWDLAFILLLFVSIAWSVYAVWGRHTAKGLHPAAMFTVISCYVSLGFVGTMVGWGHPSRLITAGIAMNGIAFISGVVCIAAAHCAFHYAQVRLGSAYCSSIQLITPFITHIIALILWPDESLRWVQWLGGFMLIAGSFWVIQTQKTLES